MRGSVRSSGRQYVDPNALQARRFQAIQAMRPYAWYDANVGGTSDGMPDISGNDRDPITNGAGSNAALYLPYINEPKLTLQATSRVNVSGTWPIFPAGEFTIVFDAYSDDWNSVPVRRKFYMHDGTYNIIMYSAGGFLVCVGAASAVVSTGHPTSGRVQFRIRRNANTSSSIAWRTDGVVDPAASGWTVSGSGAITDQFVYAQIGDDTDTSEGIVYGLDVYDSTSALRVQYDPARAGQSSHVDLVSGITWTNSRNTAGRKLVVQSPAANSAESLFLFGTDDSMTGPANAIPTMVGAAWEYVIIGRNHLPIPDDARWANWSGGGFASVLYETAERVAHFINNGTTGSTPNIVTGQKFCMFASGNGATTGYLQFNNSAETSDTRTNLQATSWSIGIAGATTAMDMEFRGVLIFDRRLTVAERSLINAAYKAGL